MELRHFDRQLTALDVHIAEMVTLVDKALVIACEGLLAPYHEVREVARVVESRVDALDFAIEETSQVLMALQAPVAADLRRLLSTMRIAVVLENLGDEAENIAKRARYLARHQVPIIPAVVSELIAATLAAYRQAVPVLGSGDIEAARAVKVLETETDRLAKLCYQALGVAMKVDLDHLAEHAHLLRAVGRLEHAADLCVELVETAVFLHSGVSIRHRHKTMALP